jgi:hypothetical protein
MNLYHLISQLPIAMLYHKQMVRCFRVSFTINKNKIKELLIKIKIWFLHHKETMIYKSNRYILRKWFSLKTNKNLNCQLVDQTTIGTLIIIIGT